MATKIYTVVKDGEELEKLKTLAAAKKLADTEGAEVYCDGECVYRALTETVEDTVPETESGAAPAREEEETKETPAETAKADEKPKAGAAERYRIRALMNVRKGPSLDAEKVGYKNAGDLVEAKLKGDWLQLSEGSFVLFKGGEFAERI